MGRVDGVESGAEGPAQVCTAVSGAVSLGGEEEQEEGTWGGGRKNGSIRFFIYFVLRSFDLAIFRTNNNHHYHRRTVQCGSVT